jgi:hypothetical protein
LSNKSKARTANLAMAGKKIILEFHPETANTGDGKYQNMAAG